MNFLRSEIFPEETEWLWKEEYNGKLTQSFGWHSLRLMRDAIDDGLKSAHGDFPVSAVVGEFKDIAIRIEGDN